LLADGVMPDTETDKRGVEERTCAANLGRGSDRGPSVASRSRGNRRGSVGGKRFSGLSSHRGVPGRLPSTLSPPLMASVLVAVSPC
jgi:hypothetical protein